MRSCRSSLLEILELCPLRKPHSRLFCPFLFVFYSFYCVLLVVLDGIVHTGLTIKTSALNSRCVRVTIKPRLFLFKAEQHKAYFSSRPKINGCALLEYKTKITWYINFEDCFCQQTLFLFCHQQNQIKRGSWVNCIGIRPTGWGLTEWAKDWQEKLGERGKKMGPSCPAGWGFSAKCKSACMVRNRPSGVWESILHVHVWQLNMSGERWEYISTSVEIKSWTVGLCTAAAESCTCNL